MELIIGTTKNGEIYRIEAEAEDRNGSKNYFSMTGETIIPITYASAVEQSRESLEDGELWKQAVEAGTTTEGLDDWIDYVLSTDGEISMVDTSLEESELTIDGIDYVFESGSCGQHEENETDLNLMIKAGDYRKIRNFWNKYHMKDIPDSEWASLKAIFESYNITLEEATKKALELYN